MRGVGRCYTTARPGRAPGAAGTTRRPSCNPELASCPLPRGDLPSRAHFLAGVLLAGRVARAVTALRYTGVLGRDGSATRVALLVDVTRATAILRSRRIARTVAPDGGVAGFGRL